MCDVSGNLVCIMFPFPVFGGRFRGELCGLQETPQSLEQVVFQSHSTLAPSLQTYDQMEVTCCVRVYVCVCFGCEGKCSATTAKIDGKGCLRGYTTQRE